MKYQNRKVLKLLLAVSALGWGVSICGVFLPWNTVAELLQGLGAEKIPQDPMFNYWLRMASGGFFIIGVLFAISAWNVDKYQTIIPVLGWLNIFEGVVLATYGFVLKLKPFPFYGDVAFCLLSGIGIVIFSRLSQKPSTEQKQPTAQ